MELTRNRGLAIALVGIAALLAVARIAYRPPQPLRASAPVSAFSAYRAKAILQTLAGSGVPHPIGSPDNARVRAAILTRLSALGYTSELQTGLACDDGVCAYPVNIVAERGPPSADGDDVLLAAHYDSVPAGPGASDDGVGVATALEIARILTTLPATRHRIILLFTDGEEAGLLGARLFVRDHPLARGIRAAVNLDARGTSGSSLMFETGSANAWLMRMYGSVIARPVTNSLYYTIYKQLPNDTDFTVFKAAGYQGFNFALIGNVGYYHTPLDNVADAAPDSIQHHGDNALAVLSALANSASLRPPVDESVFFDVYGRALILWRAQWTLPVALLMLALLAAEGVILLRARVVTSREISWGAVGALGTLVSGTAVCTLLLAVGIAVGKVPPLSAASWIAHPAPMHIAAAALALLAAVSISVWLTRRAGAWGFWLASAFIGAFLAVVCAVLAPGASFVLLLGTGAAIVGALPAILRAVRHQAPRIGALEFAAILPTLVIFAGAYPLLRLVYLGLGSPAWPVSTLVLSIVTVSLLPLLTVATARARTWVTVIAVMAAASGALLMLVLPTYSAQWPQRVNVEYWLDADSGQGHDWVQCDSQRLPSSFAAAAHFDAALRPRFDGSDAVGFYAAAQARSLAAPELTTFLPETSSRANVAGRVDFHLRSVRGAPEVFVVFPSSAHIEEAAMQATTGPLRVRLYKLHSGATLLGVIGLPVSGVDFSVETPGPMPLAVQVFDQSYGSQEPSLQSARLSDATSSHDGDLTIVYRVVTLAPAAGR